MTARFAGWKTSALTAPLSSWSRTSCTSLALATRTAYGAAGAKNRSKMSPARRSTCGWPQRAPVAGAAAVSMLTNLRTRLSNLSQLRKK